MSTNNNSKKKEFLINFAAGGVSAVISKSANAPVERIKLLLQTQDANLDIIKSGRRYTGITDCFKRVIKEEGVRAFWKGNFPNILRYFPTQALNFAFKDTYKNFFKTTDKDASFSRKFLGNLLAGGCAGATSLAFIYPLDFARQRLGVDISGQFKGLTNCLSTTLKSDGRNGLYRGFGVSVLGIFFYRAAYFGLYDTAKTFMGNNVLVNFVVAFTTTIASGLAAYPLDSIRRRLMMQSGRAEADIQYTGAVDCFKKVLQQEGFKGFYKGCLINVMSGLAASLMLVSYDQIKAGSKNGRKGGDK